MKRLGQSRRHPRYNRRYRKIKSRRDDGLDSRKCLIIYGKSWRSDSVHGAAHASCVIGMQRIMTVAADSCRCAPNFSSFFPTDYFNLRNFTFLTLVWPQHSLLPLVSSVPQLYPLCSNSFSVLPLCEAVVALSPVTDMWAPPHTMGPTCH